MDLGILTEKKFIKYDKIFQGLEPEDYIKDLDDDTKDIENNGDGDVVLLQVDRLSISKLEPEIHKNFEGKCSNYENRRKKYYYKFVA